MLKTLGLMDYTVADYVFPDGSDGYRTEWQYNDWDWEKFLELPTQEQYDESLRLIFPDGPESSDQWAEGLAHMEGYAQAYREQAVFLNDRDLRLASERPVEYPEGFPAVDDLSIDDFQCTLVVSDESGDFLIPEDGYVATRGAGVGEFWLNEVMAPDGYQVLNAPLFLPAGTDTAMGEEIVVDDVLTYYWGGVPNKGVWLTLENEIASDVSEVPTDPEEPGEPEEPEEPPVDSEEPETPEPGEPEDPEEPGTPEPEEPGTPIEPVQPGTPDAPTPDTPDKPEQSGLAKTGIAGFGLIAGIGAGLSALGAGLVGLRKRFGRSE